MYKSINPKHTLFYYLYLYSILYSIPDTKVLRVWNMLTPEAPVLLFYQISWLHSHITFQNCPRTARAVTQENMFWTPPPKRTQQDAQSPHYWLLDSKKRPMFQLNTTRCYNQKDRNTGEERNWNSFTGTVEIKTVRSIWKMIWQFPQRVNTNWPHNLAIPFPGKHPRERKLFLQKILYKNVQNNTIPNCSK